MRLMSYNIHKGIGGRDRRYRLNRIIEVIEEARPDVMCLQEVDQNVRRSRYHDQPKLLAEHFEVADSHYQQNVFIKKGGYGNLILSRWPFISQYQVSLRLGQYKPRGAQLVVIQTPSGPLHLVHWHLGLREKERRWQVRQLLGHVLFQENAKLPTLFVGDTNDWRDRLASKVFPEHQVKQATNPPRRFRSFPAYLPMVSVDKLFYRGPVMIENIDLMRTKISRRASDHLPLVADVKLTNR